MRVDVATKMLTNKLTELLHRVGPMASDSPEDVSRQINRAAASKLFSRRWTRHLPDRSKPRNPAHSKPHPSQA